MGIFTDLLNKAQVNQGNHLVELQKRGWFTGDFEGISAQGIDTLKSKISKYCDQIEQHIQTFNANGQINNSIRGSQLEEAVRGFVTAIKELLAAYVSVMRQNVEFATKAYAAYENVQKNVAKNVSQNADSIRKQAESIRLK